MYTIDNYLNNIKLLTSSLVVKHHDIGIVMNKWLYNNQGIAIPTDYKLWKYYLNLSGVKHATNNDVLITLGETGAVVSLTNTLITEYPAIHQELDSRLDSYKALLLEYPDDTLYINGCLNPVDIDTAIAAKDGSILSYSKQYIEPQEYSLIRELSVTLGLYLDRWYIKEYNITDDLYMSSVWSVMYANIPNMITSKRLNDSYTSEANSFHIEHFFRSHLDIWDNVKPLKQTTIRWLYRNLVSLINNVGSNETFNTVIDKIFTDNGIGLANYTLTQTPHNINNSTDILEPVYKISPPEFTARKLNQQYSNPETKLLSVDVIKKVVNGQKFDVFTKEDDLAVLTETTLSKIGGVTTLTQPTKIIDFGKVTLFKSYNNSLLETVLDNWLVLAYNGRYVHNIDFVDPNTKDVYKLNTSTGIVLFYYLLFNRLGTPDPVMGNVRYRNLLNQHVSKSTLLLKTLPANGTDYIADLILSRLPVTPPRITAIKDFQDSITSQLTMYKDIWTVDSNLNNTFLNGNVKEMVRRTYLTGTINISNNTAPVRLVDLLSSNGINIDITSTYNIDQVMVSLFKSFTGYELQTDALVAEVYNNLEVLFEKLTSYTLQTLATDITTDNMVAPYTTIAVNQTKNGYIRVREANTVSGLEPIQGVTSGIGNDFLTYIKADRMPVPGIIGVDIANGIQLLGYSNDKNRAVAELTKAKTYIEILRAGYDKYGPGQLVEANNRDQIESYDVNINSMPPGVFTAPTTDDIYAVAHNEMVTTAVPASAEILGADYPIYAPTEAGVANTLDGIAVDAVANTGLGSVVTTAPTVDDIYVSAQNAVVTASITTTAEVLGSDYTKP